MEGFGNGASPFRGSLRVSRWWAPILRTLRDMEMEGSGKGEFL
jgi:hypothetical protein